MTERDSEPEAAEENPLNESSAHRIIFFFFEKKKDNTTKNKTSWSSWGALAAILKVDPAASAPRSSHYIF